MREDLPETHHPSQRSRRGREVQHSRGLELFHPAIVRFKTGTPQEPLSQELKLGPGQVVHDYLNLAGHGPHNRGRFCGGGSSICYCWRVDVVDRRRTKQDMFSRDDIIIIVEAAMY